jgi:autotransporter-associated beta strand protein
MCNIVRIFLVSIVISVLLGTKCVLAMDGFWSVGADNPGNWSVSTNWTSGIIADGFDSIASFQLDTPTGGSTVYIDAPVGQTIGKLTVGYDLNPTSSGGWLFYGKTLNIASTTSSGQLVIDNLGNGKYVEISAPIEVADGTNLSKLNGGRLKLSGNTKVNNGNTTIGDGSTIDLTGSLSTLMTTPFNPAAPPSNGITYINGGSSINMSGSSQLTGGYLISLGMDAGNGAINVNDSANINAVEIRVGDHMDPRWSTDSGGHMSVNNNAVVTTTGDFYVGNKANGVLNINGNATMTVGGTLYTSVNAYWYDSGGGVWIGVPNSGTVNVSGTSKLNAETISLEGNWVSTGYCTGYLNVTDSATVTTTGDLRVARRNGSTAGTLTIDKNAQVNVAGQLAVGMDNNVSGTVNISALPGETAKLTAGSIALGLANTASGILNVSGYAIVNTGSITISPTGRGGTRQLNLSDNATVATTGNLNIGSSTDWTRTTFIEIKNNSSLNIGGEANLYDAYVYISNDAKMSVVGDLILGHADIGSGAAYSDLDVTGRGASTSTALTVGGNMTISSGKLVVNGISNSATPGDGQLGLTGVGSKFYFNGADLSSGVNSTTFMQGLSGAVIQAGGARFNLFDNNALISRNITIAQPLQGSVGDGGLSVGGDGTLILTGALTYTGTTTLDGASTLKIFSPGTTSLSSVITTGATPNTHLVIGNGLTQSLVSFDSVAVSNLTIGAGSKLTIKPLTGATLSSSAVNAVPEPSILVLLTIAVASFIIFARPRYQ